MRMKDDAFIKNKSGSSQQDETFIQTVKIYEDRDLNQQTD